ncbi:uncharacterized protein LOC144905421 [Branchiostoma floridae x Branchiostoma belcheri]
MSIQGVRRYFIFIKNKVSSDWKDLAWCLGFEAPDIENVKGKEHDDKSRCMELLWEWHKRKGNAATIHVLMEALKNAQLQLVVDSLKGEFPELNEKPNSDMGKAENIEAIRKEIKMLEENSKKALLEQKAEMNKKIQQLQETMMKEMEARNEELLTAKQPVEGGSQQKSQVQTTSDQHYMDKPTASNTGQVKQSVVQPKRKYTETGVKSSAESRTGKLLTAKQPVEGGSQQKDPVTLQHMSEQQLFTDEPTATVKEELLTAKQPVEGGSLQKDQIQTMSDKPKATNTGQVKQSVVQPKRKDTGTNVRPIRVGQPWVRKVSFGGSGSGRGEFNCPLGVAVSHDNEVYIADYWNSRIQVFTMDGVYIREFTTTLPGGTGEKLKPEDVAVDRNDNLWVVGDEHVVQYSREGTCLATIDLPYVKYLRGITVSMATEQVIVTEYDDQKGRLRVFNQDGSEVGTYGSGHRSPEPWWPRYVTVDGEGNILVTDVINHCVHVLDREGNFKFAFGSEGSDESQLKHPQGICVDGKGNIIVADKGNGCVKMFDSQGRFLCDIGSGMKKPQAVTVSPGGDVVVTHLADDTVSVWTQG